MVRKSLKRFVWLILPAGFAGIFFLCVPWHTEGLSSHPHPARSYEESVQRIEAFMSREPAAMNPACHLLFMTHGRKVNSVIVLVHGYTSCPRQFRELGQALYALGSNVLIAPLPHHGLADRMTEEQGRLSAEELVAYADEMIDTAQGMGEQVTMVGLSAGGVTTAWAAQHRRDLNLGVIISPAFGFKVIPTFLTAVTMNVVLFLPDSFRWWDPLLQDKAGLPYTYPRYSKHALAQILRLGFAVRENARQTSPASHKILVVTNDNDNDVNNDMTATIVNTWLRHDARLRSYRFSADLKLGHDLIDPARPDARTDIVYPRLIELITQQMLSDKDANTP